MKRAVCLTAVLAAVLAAEIPDAVDLTAYVPKSTFDKKASEAADLSKKLKGKMSEDELAQAEREKAQAENDQRYADLEDKYNALVKKSTIAEYTAKFVAQGYDAALAEDTAKAMADGDMEKVFSNGEKYKAALEKKIKADLMSGTPKPGGSGGEGKTEDAAVAKAREIAKARHGGEATYNDILSKYKK